MAAFLVELPDLTGYTLPEGSNKMVVFATDAANARALCAGKFDGDSGVAWTNATVTQIQATDDFSDPGWSLHIAIGAAVPVIEINALGGVSGVNTVAVNSGGTATYIVGEIITAVGGTFTRAATFRVTAVSVGVITAVEVIDPGEYTVAPSLTANAVTGGSGTVATMDLTMSTNQYMNFLAEAVGLLNADAQIAGSLVSAEDSAGTPIFTVSDITDALGDLTLTAEFRLNGTAVPQLIGTIVDGGIAGAVLTFELVVTPAGAVSVPTALKG